LGRGGDQHVEQQRDHRSLPDAEQDEPEENGNFAPVVAHDKGEPHERNGAQNEAVAADLPRRQPVVESDDQHCCEEHRKVKRHHRNRRRDGRAALTI
jgi:hypothetical protein